MVRYHWLLYEFEKYILTMDIEKYRRQDSSLVSDKDRIIYKEVLLACEHGIYRGAYVLAWIAIIESLKGKIYDLADE